MASKMALRTCEEYERSRGDQSSMFSALAEAFTIDRVPYPADLAIETLHISVLFLGTRVDLDETRS
jgi:hypothetical protein